MKAYLKGISRIISTKSINNKKISAEQLNNFIKKIENSRDKHGNTYNQYGAEVINSIFDVYVYDEKLMDSMIKLVEHHNDYEFIHSILNIFLNNVEIKENIKPDDYDNIVKFLKRMINCSPTNQPVDLMFNHNLYSVYKLFMDNDVAFGTIESCSSGRSTTVDEIYMNVYNMLINDADLNSIKFWLELVIKEEYSEMDAAMNRKEK